MQKKQIDDYNIEKAQLKANYDALNKANEELKVENIALNKTNEELQNTNETLVASKGDSNKQAKALKEENDRLLEDKAKLNKTNSEQTIEIDRLTNELETQKKTSEDNMNKIISTLAVERNQLLQRLQEEADAQAKTAAEANADAQAKVAEAQQAQRKMESNKTESMRNIEKIEQQIGVNIQDIQSKLWETSKTYMTKQYGTEEFNTNIAADPFVQAELKTLLNDTTELGNAEAIQEAHKKSLMMTLTRKIST